MELIISMKVHCLIHLRFYVVTKFELPKLEDLILKTISYDSDCKYLDDAKSRKDYPIELIEEMKIYCVK